MQTIQNRTKSDRLNGELHRRHIPDYLTPAAFLLKKWMLAELPDAPRLNVLMRDDNEASFYVGQYATVSSFYKVRVDTFFACLVAGVFDNPFPQELYHERSTFAVCQYLDTTGRAIRLVAKQYPGRDIRHDPDGSITCYGIPFNLNVTKRRRQGLVQLSPDQARKLAQWAKRTAPRKR